MAEYNSYSLGYFSNVGQTYSRHEVLINKSCYSKYFLIRGKETNNPFWSNKKNQLIIKTSYGASIFKSITWASSWTSSEYFLTFHNQNCVVRLAIFFYSEYSHMNSMEEEKDNSKCLEKIISLFLNYFFQNWFYLREGGVGSGTPRDMLGIIVMQRQVD